MFKIYLLEFKFHSLDLYIYSILHHYINAKEIVCSGAEIF